MNKLLKFGAVAALLGAGFSTQAMASETLGNFLMQTKVNGQVRAFYFDREFGSTKVPNVQAFSLAGILNLHTAEFLDGFSLGASFYTAHSLGANNFDDNDKHLDTTLMGNRYSINALGQAYIQYRNQWALVKAGDQIINTPWMNASDSRVLPATYQGIFADLTPVRNLHLYALKTFRWKSRTSSGYYKDNLYFPTTYSGDNAFGGSGGLPSSAAATQGAYAAGAGYKYAGANLNVWYYGFQQFADMIYADGDYKLKTGTGFDPFAGGQFVREWKSDSELNGVSFNGLPAGNGADALAYGFKAGVDSPFGQLMFGYDDITSRPGAIGGGAIVSPYTASYATDPLYTTSMIYGQVERGPGHSWKVKYTKKMLDNNLVLMAAFARYHSTYNGNSNNAYLDLTYNLGGALKGLSLRDRVEDAVFGDKRGPGGGSTFVYNRVMVQYDF